MIFGAHLVLYSADADADRAFLTEILGLDSVDAGGGWLIFALPPAEAAIHPAEAPAAELYLLCDDLETEMRTLAGRGVACSAVEEPRSGLSHQDPTSEWRRDRPLSAEAPDGRREVIEGEMDLAELLALPGVEEECVLRSAVGFMALHGGSQDRGTHEIASRAAERAGSSYYAIVQPSGVRVHLTSRLHNPDHSERLQAFLGHVQIAISVHGFGRDSFDVRVDALGSLVLEPYGPALRGRQTGPLRGIIVGGRNPDLLEIARRLLDGRFAGYHLADERVRLGFHPDNPVNLPPAQGVQIELPPGLRGIGDLGEELVPRQDGVVTDVIAALVELADRARGLLVKRSEDPNGEVPAAIAGVGRREV